MKCASIDHQIVNQALSQVVIAVLVIITVFGCMATVHTIVSIKSIDIYDVDR